MALTVVKYRKTATGETTGATPAILIKNKVAQQSPHIIKKSIIKLDGSSTGLIINKIPATIKPAMKRSSTTSVVEPINKSTKYSVQQIASAGTPLTSFQWQQTIGGAGGTTITPAATPKKQQQIGAAISSLPPNTIIQATGGGGTPITNIGSGTFLQTNGGANVTPAGTTISAVSTPRPTIYIKREYPKRTIRSVTLELIEKNPFVHLGLMANRLSLLKNVICSMTNVSLIDCYITLKKLRQNEEFALLSEYFEMSESEVQQIFTRTVVKLARYMRYLIRWPDSKKYYDRHKNLPFAFRSNLSHVQSLIECVETDMHCPLNFDCSIYKFILSITPNGIISYVSDAYVGQHDDLTIFNVSNFHSVIPKYLSLVADPGKAVRRKRKSKQNNSNQAGGNSDAAVETDSTTDSADESADDMETEEVEECRSLSRYAAQRIAGELASHQSLNVVNSELKSTKVKDFSIPTMRVREPVCRLQIRHMINCLREFKILQPYAIKETILFQYLNEIIVVVAALTNLQR